MLHRRIGGERAQPLRNLVGVAEMRRSARLDEQQRAQIFQGLAQKLAQIAALLGGGVDGANAIADGLADDVRRERKRRLIAAKPKQTPHIVFAHRRAV